MALRVGFDCPKCGECQALFFYDSDSTDRCPNCGKMFRLKMQPVELSLAETIMAMDGCELQAWMDGDLEVEEFEDNRCSDCVKKDFCPILKCAKQNGFGEAEFCCLVWSDER